MDSANKITKPGVYVVAEDDYHADKPLDAWALSSSGVQLIMDECPAHYAENRKNPRTSSDAQDAGKLAHKWLLEGDRFTETYEALPAKHNPRNDAGKAAIGKIKSKGKIPVKYADMETVKAMRAALLAHPIAGYLYGSGKPERSLYWRDEEFGIWCRCRLDWLPTESRFIAEYKTTKSANPTSLARDLFQYGYYLQAEWNLSGVRALGLIADPRAMIVCQEKTPPYLVTVTTPSNAAMLWAETVNRKARQIFAKCMASGDWPGYADGVQVLDLPVWAESQLTYREERGDFAIAEG